MKINFSNIKNNCFIKYIKNFNKNKLNYYLFN